MRELKVCRRIDNLFTVTVAITDYNAFPYDGTFPDNYYHYRIDTEEKLLSLLNEEDELFAEEIETIYFGKLDVTEKYLEHESGVGYKLRPCYKVS